MSSFNHNLETKELKLQSDVLRLAQEKNEIIRNNYLSEDENILGFGYGGSESLTIFLEKPGREKFVRKVLSEKLITPKWDREGQDVMLPPCQKARSQTKYLMGLPDEVTPLFPQVFNVVDREEKIEKDKQSKVYHEYIYDMSFIPGIEVSQFIRKYQPSKKIVAALYCEIFRVLNEKVHANRRRIPSHSTLEQSYFSKIEKRLNLCKATAPKTFGDRLLQAENIVIDGQIMRNVPRLLRELRENKAYQDLLEPRFHSLVMGDTNTENIKIGNIEPLLRDYDDFSFNNIPFTAEELELKFLDPRAIGFHENGVDTCADDPMYDNKPWHNSLGNYDKIHGEHFDIAHGFYGSTPYLAVNFHENNPYEYSYNGIEEYFKDVMNAAWKLNNPYSDINQNDPNWLIRFAFIMGTHFMAMPPFHFSRTKDNVLIDDALNQKRPLAIYAEGIKWLNLALDMLEGHVTEFHGMPVANVEMPTMAVAA